MAGKLRGYAHRIDINADTARVWRALTEPAALAIERTGVSLVKPSLS